MAGVYVMLENGSTEVMERIRCENEDRELQRVLENNPDLLPGDQIDPENPRRWLLVKREMPVPDPNTGLDRWSIDFLFADQDAIPTFVECKRFADTRSRREVVGQMIEYAANGHYYWGKAQLRDYADDAAKRKNSTLDDAIRSLQPTASDSLDAFFDRLQQNLREGQLRIVFFLEESPMELRSVVDFLNKQMERSEVLLVEARQYISKGMRVVVPTLFGYTEEARQVKRTITITTAASRKKWDKETYFADAQAKLATSEVTILESLYVDILSLGFEVTWGTGQNDGSFSVKDPSICPRAILAVYSSGRLTLNFGWLNGNGTAEQARDMLKKLMSERVGLQIQENYALKYPGFSMAEWGPKKSLVVGVLKRLVEEFRSRNEKSFS
jgi:hypothetical protein